MNKLYILGALALSGTHAYVNFLPASGTAGTTLTAVLNTNPFNTYGLGGSYAYTYTGDCLASSTLVTLGLNNNYYQYYSYAMTKGTWAYTAAAPITYKTDPTTPLTGTTSKVDLTYTGCYHSHIYNWIAMPAMSGTATTTNGFGSAVSAYGYSMSGTATTDCTVQSIVTTDIFLAASTTFKGGQYQTSDLTITDESGATITILSVWGQHGPGYFATKAAASAIIQIATIQVGLQIVAQNSYWDFMQSNVIQGLTTLGRGGGDLTNGPCGWYVGYFYEAPTRGTSANEDEFNKLVDGGGVTLNFWTDNSLLNAASAFVVAGLAGLLF